MQICTDIQLFERSSAANLVRWRPGNILRVLPRLMKASIQHGLFKAAHACGYTVVPNWRLDNYPQTIYLQKLFALLNIDCVLDVGANLGQYRDFLRDQVGFK